MDLLEIWATWIFDRYERVKKSLTYILHFSLTQPCDASNGNYFLSGGKQTFVFIKAVNLFRAVPDPDLEIMGTRSSRLLDGGVGRQGQSPKNFFQDFGPQFGLKMPQQRGQICFWKGREVV